jgi:hypothetical protein
MNFLTKDYKINNTQNIKKRLFYLNENSYWYIISSDKVDDSFSVLRTTPDTEEYIINSTNSLIIDINILISIFHLNYPSYLIENKTKDGIFYTLDLKGEDLNSWYKKSFTTFSNALEKIDKEKTEYVVSKYFAGFTKNENKLKLFAYEQCSGWNNKNKQGKTFNSLLKKNFGQRLKKFYILYYKTDSKLHLKNDKSIIKHADDIFNIKN